MKKFVIVFLLVLVPLLILLRVQNSWPVNVVRSYGTLPLVFEPNVGQTAPDAKFLCHGGGYSLFLTSSEMVMVFRHSKKLGIKEKYMKTDLHYRELGEAEVLRVKLANANEGAQTEFLDPLSGKSNYLIGNDRKQWHTDITQYSKVKVKNIYPGVDLIYHGNQRLVEHDFMVQPGADFHSIQFVFSGAQGLSLDQGGDLVIKTKQGQIVFKKPDIYQLFNGVKNSVSGGYSVQGNDRAGFTVGVYDHTVPLVIDPTLLYSTYVGGNSGDQGNGIAVDSAGEAYVVGGTQSVNFPTLGALQPGLAGTQNAFVSKINAAGTGYVYSTYLGGGGIDGGQSIAIDGFGNAYIVGFTTSNNFPCVNAIQGGLAGAENIFVAKINPAGNGLVFSTYLGGSSQDAGLSVALDSAFNAYLTGATSSPNFPTANALQPVFGGGAWDAYVTEINAAGGLVFSTYLGGSLNDQGNGIAIDGGGNVCVAGVTMSMNFPTQNPFQAAALGTPTVFVCKLAPGGGSLVYSTYLTGSINDFGQGIAADPSGNAYVVGVAESSDFPLKNPIQPTLHGGVEDAFITVLNPAGSGLVYSTFLGGSGVDEALSVAVDSSGNAYITGDTSSSDFPLVNPYQGILGGAGFATNAFVAEIDAAGDALLFSTFLGGSVSESGLSIAVDGGGSMYVTGKTSSPDFPLLNPIQAAYGGGQDGFVSKIGMTPTPTPTNTPTYTPTTVPTPPISITYTYPNPIDFTLHPYVTIAFPADSDISISIVNMVGETVATVPAAQIHGMEGWARWDGKDSKGKLVASGIYFYFVRSSKLRMRQKFTILD